MGDGMLRFDGLLAESVFRPNDVGPQTTTTLLPLEEIMADHIQTALKRADGRVEGKNGAARLLGLHPSTLRGRMRKLGIPYGKKDRCHGHPNQ
jgi:transcriptional regulator with GAF, ATPase, and Fis domain